MLAFDDALLAGLANDGGLYVPEAIPTLTHAEIAAFAGKPFAEIAFEVVRRFTGGAIPDAILARHCREAYATFGHPATCPLVQTAPNDFVLELFHGPTLAFKDVAMQLISRLMDHVLAERAERVTIVGATSGDTGAAAVEAFRGRAAVDLVILFPKGRISEVQRRQMTCAAEGNVHVLAIEGTFDDCQAIVKGMFGHERFRRDVRLAGINSINWGRIVAQVTYYFTAAVALGAPGRAVAFSVPTGNFGDVYAGYVAKRMGLPVAKLVVATNVNDILARALATGVYEVRGVTPTTAPSMDIQVSSNFERLMFDAHGRDPAPVRAAMASLAQSRRFEIAAAPLAAMRADFAGVRVDEAATAATIRATQANAGYLLDPHTAIGVAATCHAGVLDAPMVTLATAHPAKFPDAVAAACGVTPALPPRFDGLFERAERVTVLPADQGAVERFVRSVSRVATAEAA
jgi:threonine synthase